MTVLVGFIPTAVGEAAFAAALSEAQRRQEDLLVVNSPRDGAPVSAALAPESLIEELTHRASAAGIDITVRQEPHTGGELADAILRIAREANASVIVIGLRQRSAVGKLLLGSTAQRILLDADRPVLAVKV
jgi:nucleotide-binding universal stress UspA family protein